MQLPNISLRAGSTVSAEERKGEESSLQSLRNSDQFFVLNTKLMKIVVASLLHRRIIEAKTGTEVVSLS